MYVGLMFGTGASALIAKALGEGNKERARQIFSTAIYTLIFQRTRLTPSTVEMIRRDGTRIRTGFMGTPHILHALSRHGFSGLRGIC
ncbi:MAG: hypothetical protein IKO25_01070 [Clostridia bacterium]|nr:hypothetical protein [Clostridia bacterium]